MVVLADGSAPDELVEIYGGCQGVQNFIAVADSKGRVSFNLNVLGDTSKTQGCSWHASLDGYRSATKTLTDIKPKSEAKLGTIVLQPLSSDTASLTSSADRQVSKAQRKMCEKALDEAAEQHWSTAIALLKKVTSAYPEYSSAWLTLGILQQSRGYLADAEKSFLESARADPKFALPLIRAAALEATQGDWRATLDHSQKAIDLNPAAFPNAYALNAMANVSLQNAAAAERSAREGLKLDTDHQYPELEYALGVVLYSKNDFEGATKHLKAYVEQSPDGANAVVARKQLAQMPAEPAAAPALITSSEGESAQPNRSGLPSQPGAVSRLLQDRNAALLVKTPDHTCLESISRARLDTRGQLHGAETVRVEIAIAGGKEIYTQAGGKRFTNEGLADMLGYTFSTTGLFSSIARALIAGNDIAIEPAGKEVLNGESVFRYNFHILPGAKGWSIQYGKESGEAGEEGWFLVASESLILRRVVVQAIDIPRELKLKNLRTVIDYEPVTIAGRRVLLPDVAQVSVEEKSGIHRVSRIFFDHCRVFGSESALSFDADAGHAQNNRQSQRPGIPPDLNVAVLLGSPLSLAVAAANDVVRATVAQPVLSNGHEIIARGAMVEGHVRLRRGENAVVIELDRVQTLSGWAPFYAHLVSLASNIPQARTDREDTRRGANPPARKSADSAMLADPEIPGVAKISFLSRSAELPAGTQMIWKTEPLLAPTDARAPQLNTSVEMQ